MSGELFRYVPQIDQVGVDDDPAVVQLLADRDRQLEDYLSLLSAETALATTVYRTTSQTILDQTFTNISFDAYHDDDFGIFAAGTNLTVDRAGLYQPTAAVQWTANPAGVRQAAIALNANVGAGNFGTCLGQDTRGATPDANGTSYVTSHAIAGRPVRMEPGDYLNLHVYQTLGTGGSLAVPAVAGMPSLSIVWLGD